MNILLSRILTYLNGAFVVDDYYRFCKFVVYNYLGFEDFDIDDVVFDFVIEMGSGSQG